jgi:dihydropteroate synthase
MNEVSEKFGAKRDDVGARSAAKALKISVASFYNYINKADLPSFEVLKRAHDRWNLNFTYIDFGSDSPTPSPSETDQPRQYVLPFIKGVRESDIEIIRAKAVKPDTLQLTVNIRFAG